MDPWETLLVTDLPMYVSRWPLPSGCDHPTKVAITSPQTLNTRYSLGIWKWEIGLRKSSSEKHAAVSALYMGKYTVPLVSVTAESEQVLYRIGGSNWLASSWCCKVAFKWSNEDWEITVNQNLSWPELCQKFDLIHIMLVLKNLLMDFTFRSRFLRVKAKLCFTGAAHAVLVCG